MSALGFQITKGVQFYVLCFGMKTKDLRLSMQRKISNQYIQFLYFLMDEEHIVRLLTFIYYSPGSCKVIQLKEVNRFVKATGGNHRNFPKESLKTFINVDSLWEQR